MFRKIKTKLNFSFFIAIISLVFIFYTIKDYNESNTFNENIGINLSPIGTITKEKKYFQSLDLGKIGIKRVEIFLATYARDNDSKVQFLFKKGTQQKKIVENAKNIVDNAYKSFELNFSPSNSPLEIEISGVNSDDYNSITAWGTKDYKFGKIKLNGQEIENSFYVKILPEHYLTRTNLLFVSITSIIFGILYLLVGIKNKLFYTAFIISYTIITVKYPTNSFASEIWAEQGTNFFINATTKSFFENVKILDYAYLPLTQRLISLFVIKILKIQENFVVILNLFAIGLISFFFSVINLKLFNKLGLDSISKFLISIYLILFYEIGYENATFINFIYFGVLPCFLFLFLDFKKLEIKKIIIISIITIMIMLSKGAFVSFLPLYVLLMIKTLMFREYKEFYFILSSFVAGLIQFLIMRNYSPNQVIDIYKLISKLFSLYYKNFIFVLSNNRIVNLYQGENFLIFLFVIFNFSIIYILIKKKEEILLKVFVYLNTIIIGNLSVMIISSNYTLDQISFVRTLIISNIIMYFYVIYFIFIMIKLILKETHIIIKFEKIKKIGVLTIILILYLNTLNLNKFRGEIYIENKNSHSEWEKYKKIIKNESYIIPVNPMTGVGSWAMEKNIEVIYQGDYKNLIIPENYNKKINTIIIPKSLGDELSLKVFNKNGHLIKSIKQLNNKEKNYSYFLVNELDIFKIELFKNDIKLGENYYIIIYGEK